MRIMPLEQAGILELFPDKDLTFELGEDIDSYQMTMDDKVEDVFLKYFGVHTHLSDSVRLRALELIDKAKATGSLGDVFDGFVASEDFLKLSSH